VLRRMKRGRDSTFLRKLVRKIRDRVPDLVFRTSFIVGFPGETDEQFAELCEFVEEMRFERVGVFQFSREEGTPSYDLDGQIPARVKAQRQKKLLGIQRKISKAHQAALVGKTLDVLVEGVSEETALLLEGRWMGQAPEIDGKVYVNRGTARPGEIVKVEVEQAGDYDLVGGIAGSDGPPEFAALPHAVAVLRPRPRFPILSH
jgi:ribosomal protein S12 methylthiotransferase